MIASDYNASLMLEQFTDNPFLPKFYAQPERYAFQVELFFMTERFKQLQYHFSSVSLFSRFMVSDYFFLKTKLFAKNNLSKDEFRLFDKLFEVLSSQFPLPDILVYLHRPVDALLQNIKQRNRQFEVDISSQYLVDIQNTYLQYISIETKIPVLFLELGNHDFISDKRIYLEILDLLKTSYQPGVHSFSLGS